MNSANGFLSDPNQSPNIYYLCQQNDNTFKLSNGKSEINFSIEWIGNRFEIRFIGLKSIAQIEDLRLTVATSNCQISCPPKYGGRECNANGSYEFVKECDKCINCVKCRQEIQVNISPKIQLKVRSAQIIALSFVILIILLDLLIDLFLNCTNFRERVYAITSVLCQVMICASTFLPESLMRLQWYSEVMLLSLAVAATLLCALFRTQEPPDEADRRNYHRRIKLSCLCFVPTIIIFLIQLAWFEFHSDVYSDELQFRPIGWFGEWLLAHIIADFVAALGFGCWILPNLRDRTIIRQCKNPSLIKILATSIIGISAGAAMKFTSSESNTPTKTFWAYYVALVPLVAVNHLWPLIEHLYHLIEPLYHLVERSCRATDDQQPLLVRLALREDLQRSEALRSGPNAAQSASSLKTVATGYGKHGGSPQRTTPIKNLTAGLPRVASSHQVVNPLADAQIGPPLGPLQQVAQTHSAQPSTADPCRPARFETGGSDSAEEAQTGQEFRQGLGCQGSTDREEPSKPASLPRETLSGQDSLDYRSASI